MTQDWIGKMEALCHERRTIAHAFGKAEEGNVADMIECLCELVQLQQWEMKHGMDTTHQTGITAAWEKAFKVCGVQP